jgi:hypothetical protein
MNEGVPIRTIALMVVTTVVAAGIVVLFLLHCLASYESYRVTRLSRGASQSSTSMVQTQTGRVNSAAGAVV